MTRSEQITANYRRTTAAEKEKPMSDYNAGYTDGMSRAAEALTCLELAMRCNPHPDEALKTAQRFREFITSAPAAAQLPESAC